MVEPASGNTSLLLRFAFSKSNAMQDLKFSSLFPFLEFNWLTTIHYFVASNAIYTTNTFPIFFRLEYNWLM